MVGESGGLIDLLVERSLDGAIVKEVDGLAELAGCMDSPDPLEDGPFLNELVRRRPLVPGIGWCPGPDCVANEGLYEEFQRQ